MSLDVRSFLRYSQATAAEHEEGSHEFLQAMRLDIPIHMATAERLETLHAKLKAELGFNQLVHERRGWRTGAVAYAATCDYHTCMPNQARGAVRRDRPGRDPGLQPVPV